MKGDRVMTRLFTASLVFLAWAVSATANEPLWTDQERLEKRDMVCVGTVISAGKVGRIDDNHDLYMAVVEVTSMRKGGKTATGSRINVYYEFSSSGRNDRCPEYAELAKGEKATFYLRNVTDELKNELKIETVRESAFFLEMGSDVKKPDLLPKLDGESAKGLEIECRLTQTTFVVGEPVNIWCTVKNTTQSVAAVGWHPTLTAAHP
jgi:hypothetical protein